MSYDKKTVSDEELRKKAEDRLVARQAEDGSFSADPDAERLLHELQVHRIELEMQNEELRRAESELEAMQAHYFDLYDLAPVGYCTLDEHGLILDANLTAATMLGVVRGTLVGQPISRFILKEDLNLYTLHRKQLLEIHSANSWQTAVPQKFELRMVKTDGTIFWANLDTTAANDADGVPLSRVMLSDVTERKMKEESLRASEEQHRTILHTAMDGFWLADTGGRLLEINEAYCRMSGYSVNELQTMRIPDLEAAETVEDTGDRIRKIMSLGEDRFESRHRRKDGSIFDVEVSVKYRPVEKGQLVAFLRDITGHKLAEEEKSRLEDQLQQAQKMESVGRLAGGVAHDFNNMLGVIIGYAEMALMHVDPSQPIHVYLEEIHKAARRSADLTRQLLAFARKEVISPEVLNLNETVSSSLKIMHRLIGENIQLNWRPEADLWPVRMDPSQIDQILANICVNARDAIADIGEITIGTGNCTFGESWCASHVWIIPGEFVRLSVRDNGCGMNKETLDHIFEPFFTTKEVGAGTGLGMATVFGAVKQNNGFINVDSKPGEGTTFTIYLPRYEGTVEKTRTEDAAKSAKSGQETILLVEDDPRILELTMLVLEEKGYTVLAANRPVEAIRLAGEHAGKIHLLITDVIMPEMNGRDLAIYLLARYPDLKHLFMSGYTADIIAQHGVLDEGISFIQKPFSIEGLAFKVRQALDGE